MLDANEKDYHFVIDLKRAPLAAVGAGWAAANRGDIWSFSQTIVILRWRKSPPRVLI
jgi:hypothetical protein